MAKGIIRKMDELGRIIVPKEIRDQLEWDYGDGIEITVNGAIVSLRKHNPGCTFCGVAEGDLRFFKEKLVCSDCCTRMPR